MSIVLCIFVICTFMTLLYERKNIIHKRKIISMFLNRSEFHYLLLLSEEASSRPLPTPVISF